MQQNAAAPAKRTRSRLACQRCHNRRVRCDASAWGPPCSSCIADDVAQSCRLIESRRMRDGRGRFSFKGTPVSPGAPSTTAVRGGAPAQVLREEAAAAVAIVTDAAATATAATTATTAAGTAAAAAAPDTASPGMDTGMGDAGYAEAGCSGRRSSAGLVAPSEGGDADETETTIRSSGTRVLAAAAASEAPQTCAAQVATAAVADPEADQWSDIISRDMSSVSDGRRMTYLGESFHLSYLVQLKFHGGATVRGQQSASTGGGDGGGGGGGARGGNGVPPTASARSAPCATDGSSLNLHIPIPPSQSRHHASHHDAPAELPWARAQSTPTSTPTPAQQTPAESSAQGQAHEQSESPGPGPLPLPLGIQRALIDAFCAHHTTLFPIISEAKFRAEFDAAAVSPLLLSAVLYAGAIHVGDATIYQAGFDSRQACLRRLYSRAKALFFDDDGGDADTADDRLSRVQMAFLLQNMWLHPNATMDCWTWLGFAVHLAQNMGMHRSTARSALRVEDRKLWKRIWWSLYVCLFPAVARRILFCRFDAV